MHALRFDRTGNLDALTLADLPVPTPGAGEVLVRVHAAGINPSDVKNVLGRFPYTTLPRVPGRDFAGIVVDGPARWKGQRVWGTGRGVGFTRDGTHAEFVTLPADGLSRMPDNLGFEQAAACGIPFTTAWDALQRTQVTAGTRLLVIGANGAVGLATLSLARWCGAEIVAAVRKPEEAARLAAAGFTTLLLGEPAALADAVRRHFPAGAEVSFDTTGFWLPAAVNTLADFGRLAVIAAPVDGLVQVPVLSLYRRGGVVVGVNTLLYEPAECARMFDRWTPAFESGALTLQAEPEVRPLAEGVAAYEAVHAGHAGKIVLTTA